jgi:hypothetical protein
MVRFFPLCFTAIIGDSIFHILILFTKTKLVVLRTNLQGNKWLSGVWVFFLNKTFGLPKQIFSNMSIAIR